MTSRAPVLTEHRWPWSVRLLDLLARLLLCVAAGGFAVFLVGLFAMLVLTELYPGLAEAIDRVARMAVGVYFSGAAAALLLSGFAWTALRWHAVSALRHWGADPRRVPPDRLRRVGRGSGPAGTLGVAAGWTAGLSGFALVAAVVIISEDPDPVGVQVLLGCLLVLGLGVGGLVVARRVGLGWPAHTRAAAEPWSTTLPQAVTAERERRRAVGWGEPVLEIGPPRVRTASRWLGRLGTVAMTLSAGAGLPGLVLRQPCRDCDPRTLDEAGETTIAWLVTTAFVLLLVGVLVLAAQALLALLLVAGERAVLLRGARAPRPPRVPGGVLARVVVGPSPERLLGLVLLGVGAASAPLPLVARMAGERAAWWTTAGLVGALLLLAGAALVLLDHAVGPRWRQRLRETYAPGDVDVDGADAGRTDDERSRAAGVQGSGTGGDSGDGGRSGGD